MGEPRYYTRLEERFRAARRKWAIPGRIPRWCFHRLVPAYVEVAGLLEHGAFERREAGNDPGPWEHAGMSLQHWARGRLARDRRIRAPDLDRELLSMLADGSIRSLTAMNDEALEQVRRILASGGLTPGASTT